MDKELKKSHSLKLSSLLDVKFQSSETNFKLQEGMKVVFPEGIFWLSSCTGCQDKVKKEAHLFYIGPKGNSAIIYPSMNF